MKRLTLILLASLAIVSCKKNTQDKTTVEGIILTEEGEALPNTKVGVFGMSNHDGFNGYQLVQETMSDENGLFFMELQERGDVITATKEGYFDLTARDKDISNGNRNIFEIEMHHGCKVNFTLINENNWQAVCLETPWEHQWEFFYIECFFDVDIFETSVYVLGGDTAIFKSHYKDDWDNDGHTSHHIYCPQGGEIDYTITY